MKFEEVVAEKYLKMIGFKNPKYEPNGNVAPDFEVNNIGVEVRRLNQQYEQNGINKGLEADSHSLWSQMRKWVTELNVHYKDRSFFVTYIFKRPLGDRKRLKKELLEKLQHFIHCGMPAYAVYEINERFSIQIEEGTAVEGRLFAIGSALDLDEGGYLVNDMIEALNYCISTKSNIVRKSEKNYEEWWLILVDAIAYSLEKREVELIKKSVENTGCFKKVIVIHPETSEVVLQI